MTDEYFAKLTTMFNKLREASVIVGEGELSLIALNGLDETYDPFVTAQTTWVDDINFGSLFGLLRSYKARLNHRSEFKGITTANSVQSSTIVICQI